MSSSSPTSTPAAAISTRPAFSCTPCRNRKVRCDRRRKCGNCQRRGEECIWPKLAWAIEDDSVAEGKEGSNALQSRVERLEAIVLRAGLDRFEESRDIVLPLSSTDGAEDQVGIDDLLESSDVTHHDGFDHQIISRKKRRLLDAVQVGDGTKDTPHSQLKLEQALPGKHTCDHLVEVYFERVEWIHHVVFRPTFDEWYSSYWRGGEKRSKTFLHSLALLFSMLCLALHFDDQLSTPDSERERTDFDASCQALHLGDYLSQQSVAVLQTLIMQGLWLNDMGLSEMHHANLGLAIRIANVMGLSRLDARPDGTLLSRSSFNDDTSLLEKEVKRRIYWSLVCQDAYTASSCNFTYLIQASQIKADVFLNISDEELVRLDRALKQSNGAARLDKIKREGLSRGETTSSYHIAKIPFALTAKKFVDLYNADDVSYASIYELEKETRRCHSNLPDYLQYSWAAKDTLQQRWQQLFVDITLHNRIMRLYRPFITRGYTDQKYGYSVKVTLISAKALIELVSMGKEFSFPGLRWWVVLIHIFTAGVALCIDYHYHLATRQPGLLDNLAAHQDVERREWVQRAIDLLRDVRAFSDAASRAVDILETLFSQVQTRSAHNTPQHSPPETLPEYTVDWNSLFEQALAGTSDYTTDQAILETIQTFAFGG